MEVCSRLRAVLVFEAKCILRGRRRSCGAFATRNRRFGWQVWEFVRIVKTMAGVGVRAHVKNDGRRGSSWTYQNRWQAQGMVSYVVVFESRNRRFVELSSKSILGVLMILRGRRGTWMTLDPFFVESATFLKDSFQNCLLVWEF